MGWEAAALLWIQNNVRPEWLDPAVIRFTRLGHAGMIWIAVTLVLLIIPKTRKVGCASVIALLMTAALCNGILKNAVARPRPYVMIPALHLLGPRASDWSFPSGHSCTAFSVGGICLARLPKKAGIPAIVLAALLALSRLYVGIHYPTDVIAGVALGIVIALLSMKIFDVIDARLEAWKEKRTQKEDA